MSSPSVSSPDFVFRPAWRTLRVVGPDAATWLNGIVTCDVLAVNPKRAAWGSLLTKQGKVAADLQIAGRKEELFVAVSGGDAETTLSTLDGYLVMEDAEIEASDRGWLLCSGSAKQAVEASGLQVSELGWTAAPVFVAHGSPDEVDTAVASLGDQLVEEADFRVWLIENGVPQFGVDYGSQDNLHAASLERRTVDWQKGCYLGQEVVCMQDMRGKVKKRLVRLIADSGHIEAGAELRPQGSEEAVGSVTSSGGESAIGSLKAPFFEEGTLLRAAETIVRVVPLRPDPC